MWKFLGLISFMAIACTPAIKIFDWLSGTWEMPTKRGVMVEKWEHFEKNNMKAESYRISDGQKVPLETIEIKWENGDFWYIPTVPDQNEGKPVPFKMVSIDGNSKFTFENLEHDFPQRIIYEFRPKQENLKMPGDTLIAKIEGQSDGQYRTSTFTFLRK